VSGADQGDPVTQSLAAASSSLRDTAKWLIGGVIGTAAAVFAGSSLTNIGQLSLPDDWARILVVIAGATLGFACIGDLAWRALAVLTIRTMSFAELASARDAQLSELAAAVEGRYAGALPGNLATLAALKDRIEAENAKSADQQDSTFMDRAASFVPAVMAQASFQNVFDKFDRMKRVLLVRALGAIIGFGAFAWGVNPPAPPPYGGTQRPTAVFVIPVTRPGS
jgi:hypothetical protein